MGGGVRRLVADEGGRKITVGGRRVAHTAVTRNVRHPSAGRASGVPLPDDEAQAVQDPLGPASLDACFRRSQSAIIGCQQVRFIVIDRASVLPQITGGVDAAWKFPEIAPFDCLQRPNTNLGRFSDFLQGDSPVPANRSQPQRNLLFFHSEALPIRWEREHEIARY